MAKNQEPLFALVYTAAKRAKVRLYPAHAGILGFETGERIEMQQPLWVEKMRMGGDKFRETTNFWAGAPRLGHESHPSQSPRDMEFAG